MIKHLVLLSCILSVTAFGWFQNRTIPGVFFTAPHATLPLGKLKFRQMHPVWQRVKDLNYPALPAVDANKVITSDPRSAEQWGLEVVNMWKLFTPLVQPTKYKPCSKQVVVAVIDTGIDYTHPDLTPALWRNPGEIPNNSLDDDGNGFVDDVIGWDFVNNVPLPFDPHGHGTHISGIIGAVGGNGQYGTGVCSGVSIMSLKYYDNYVLGYNNLKNTVRAIRYAVENGANIINYSGGGSDSAPMEYAAIQEAEEKGILFIAAAGNDGRNMDHMPYYPASYALPNIVSVGSVSRDGRILSSSNYGVNVDVLAPGLSILSTLPNRRMATMSGTSQSTAFVSGAAALLASQNPAFIHYLPIKTAIEQGSLINPNNHKIRFGILDIEKSLKIQKVEPLRRSVIQSK